MKIKFLPQNVSIELDQNKSVMELARENKIPISSSCNGMCSCAECRVYVIEGEANILPPSNKEIALIGDGHSIDRRRLSCQLFCYGDITVDLSEQVEKEQKKGIIKSQFLKNISKDNEESFSLGGLLIENDKEMDQISLPESEKNNDSISSQNANNDFYSKKKYKADHKKNKNRRNKRSSNWKKKIKKS